MGGPLLVIYLGKVGWLRFLFLGDRGGEGGVGGGRVEGGCGDRGNNKGRVIRGGGRGLFWLGGNVGSEGCRGGE